MQQDSDSRSSTDPTWARVRACGAACWLALAAVCPAPADQPRLDQVEHLGVEDGLSHSTVWDIIQDRQGFLWLATPRGLVPGSI